MARKSNIDLCSKFLFNDDLVLTSEQRQSQLRWRYILSKKLNEPLYRNNKLVEELMSGAEGAFTGVAQSTAYNDINVVQSVLGNIQNASKEFLRYTIIEGAKEAYEIAKKLEDAQGMTSALNIMGKYTRADKDDDRFDFSNMLPPVFEPTDDLSVVEGLQPIDNLEEKRRALRALHSGKLSDIADVESEDVE